MPSSSGGDGVPDAVPDGARIGAQLKAARLAARMSMAEVAEQAGLTKGFVSKLERDLANVSVASLIRLCDALGVSVGSLFQAPKGQVVRREARPPINFGGSKMTEYLLTPSGEKRVQAILSDIEPGGGSGKEPHSLPADVEFVFVLAGQLQSPWPGSRSPSSRATPSPSRPTSSTPSRRPPSWPHPGALDHLARPARHRPRRAAASQPVPAPGNGMTMAADMNRESQASPG